MAYDLSQRPRRNRSSAAVRGLVRETHLTPDHLIYPLFVQDGASRRAHRVHAWGGPGDGGPTP